MSAEVESMAFFGQVPWHGLGTALEEADLYNWLSACRKAGLDWDVELVPLVTADTQAKVTHKGVRRKRTAGCSAWSALDSLRSRTGTPSHGSSLSLTPRKRRCTRLVPCALVAESGFWPA